MDGIGAGAASHYADEKPASASASPAGAPPPSFLGRCVEDPARFLARSWGSAPHICHGGAERFGDLFDLAELNRLLIMGCIPHQYIRLVRDGSAARDREWVTLAARTLEFTPDGGRIARLVREGYTLSVMQMQRFAPALSAFCEGLHSELSLRVEATTYFTPAASQGFGTHYDGHDIIVLQIAGEKSWRVFDGVTDGPRWNKHVTIPASQPPVLATTLRPGDALYVPRGFVHSAAAHAQFSLHVSIGIYATTVADVLRYAIGQLAGSPALARELPVGFGDKPGDLLPLIAAGCKAVDEQVADCDWLKVLADGFCRAWAGRAAHSIIPE